MNGETGRLDQTPSETGKDKSGEFMELSTPQGREGRERQSRRRIERQEDSRWDSKRRDDARKRGKGRRRSRGKRGDKDEEEKRREEKNGGLESRKGKSHDRLNQERRAVRGT